MSGFDTMKVEKQRIGSTKHGLAGEKKWFKRGQEREREKLLQREEPEKGVLTKLQARRVGLAICKS
jgi:hypothetical protein